MRKPGGATIALHDYEPERAHFHDEVLAGLQQYPKTLPCKYFYDEAGSALFDQICELDEYYLTRTEAAIMRAHAAEMAAEIGPGAVIVEYGSGSSTKTRILLDNLAQPVAYVPIDISREHLLQSARELAEAYPNLQVLPVCADYTARYQLPDINAPFTRTVVYFPGSTIGNFSPSAAVDFLSDITRMAGPGGGLLIGVDLKKDRETLERAYNDARGITAAFNLNLLARVNRELGADFRLDRFRHRAVYNEAEGRIEIYLVSQQDQTVYVDDLAIRFEIGEPILTEYSYKYDPAQFARLARRAGFTVRRVWTDEARRFSVQYLEAHTVASP